MLRLVLHVGETAFVSSPIGAFFCFVLFSMVISTEACDAALRGAEKARSERRRCIGRCLVDAGLVNREGEKRNVARFVYRAPPGRSLQTAEIARDTDNADTPVFHG